MLSSRCVRCGAASRDFLCASCTDFLVSDRPLWLDPALLPGPSLLDLVGAKEIAILGTDLSHTEWRKPVSESTAEEAVRLVRLLHLEAGARPIVSVGDAETLHTFLRDARRAPPANRDERAALAALCRYFASCEWMPPHLAAEYDLRANVLEPEVAAAEKAEPGNVPEVLPESPPLPEVPSDLEVPRESTPEARADLERVGEETPLPAPEPLPPEPIPAPEPPLPVPEPYPEPLPEPEPEPEPGEPAKGLSVLGGVEEVKQRLEKERAEMETYVRSRTDEIRAKEESLTDREKLLASKEREVEARAQAATERLVALEKDSARQDVLRFLDTIPGMSESEAAVIATAFPEMESLRTADVKALTQCKGVTEALARAIRFELVPGEVEGEQRTTRLHEEAQGFLEEGAYEAALECYDRLLRERPEDTGVWFDRAEVLVLLGRSEEALECFARVLELDHRNRQAWFERANLLFGLGRLADAVDALRETLRLDPTKSGDLVGKAEQLRRDRHPNEAAVLFQAVLDVVPNDPRAILGLGDSLLELGDSEAAEALFTRALGKNPQNAPIVYRKGELLERKGRWGAAIQYYNRAIALRWSYLDPWLAKADILLNHDRPEEALECFEKVTTFDSRRVQAWAGQARAHAALGHRERSEEALAKAEGLDSDHPAVRAARDALARSASGTAETSPAAETATDLPALAKAFEEMEVDDEPSPTSPNVSPDFQSFVESIEPEKEDAHVLLQLAELALEGGDPQMALLRYEQAIERDPRNADAWTGKGVALQQLERYPEALDAYDRALSVNPKHELAQRWRATCVRHLDPEARG